jgi:HK97 family phage portal protein
MGRLVEGLRSFILGPYSSRDPLAASVFGYGPTTSGTTVTEWTALNYSAWWAATQIIANAVSALPLQLFRRLPNGGKEVFRTHPVYRLLHDEFNPEMTSMVARKTMQGHVLGWGNAYAEIERDTADRPLALWPLTPDRVRPDRDDADNVIYRVYQSTGPQIVIPARNMLHIPGLGFDGLMGYSVIRQARETIGLGLATEQFGAQFFGNGSVSTMVASHPGKLSKPAYDNLKQSLRDQTSGSNKHGMLLLEEGIKVEKTSIPPDDAQFLETRRFQDIEVCRWFNLPPHKLSELERATFSNIEHQAIEFVQDCLRPWLVTWEQEMNRKLIRPLERTIQFTEHNVDGLLRGDTASRYSAYAVGRQWGWLSADDVRERENLNPLPNGAGQIYLVPTNMAPADRLDELVDKQVTPAPAPQPVLAPAANGNGAGPGRTAATILAHRSLVIEAAGQMIRKEAHAARRAAPKGADGLRKWREEFYPKHLTSMCEKLLPAVRTHLVYVASTVGPQDETRRLAEAYIARSHAELEAVAATAGKEMENAIDILVSRWEIQRPPEIADALMTEELTHALGGE